MYSPYNAQMFIHISANQPCHSPRCPQSRLHVGRVQGLCAQEHKLVPPAVRERGNGSQHVTLPQGTASQLPCSRSEVPEAPAPGAAFPLGHCQTYWSGTFVATPSTSMGIRVAGGRAGALRLCQVPPSLLCLSSHRACPEQENCLLPQSLNPDSAGPLSL